VGPFVFGDVAVSTLLTPPDPQRCLEALKPLNERTYELVGLNLASLATRRTVSGG
jgi:hypothetical protein